MDLPDVDVGQGQSYHVPSTTECDQCHEGRGDRVLGFELISLAQPGAKGVTLETLVDEDLLTEKPVIDEVDIGDDGTGKAAEALGWLHINCGVSCHNDTTNSEAYQTGLRLKLDPAKLDGRSSLGFDAIATTVNKAATTPRWNSGLRIVPGNPEDSLLYQLVSVRKTGKNNQMPPIATRIVPKDEVEMIADWIRKMDRTQVDPGPGPD